VLIGHGDGSFARAHRRRTGLALGGAIADVSGDAKPMW
jgi:hypothetical protein